MYSSTVLDSPSKTGCWRQLDFSQQNADSLFPLEYRSYLGHAAHAVLQYCAERRTKTEAEIRKTAEEVGNLLISEGRIFRGREEPPLPADDVWQGVDLAINYLLTHELPLDADAVMPEREWEHPTLPYRALIDLVVAYDEGDEDYSVRVVEVTDYKSSWQAGPDELDTLQRWGQAICVWQAEKDLRMFGEIDIIRKRIVNLRTQAEYTRDIHLDDPDEVDGLERWEDRIAQLCRTAQQTQLPDDAPFGENIEIISRPANPGVGCLSCAYRHLCPQARAAWQEYPIDINELAMRLAQIEGQRTLIIQALKEADSELPIPITGGYVGYQEQVRKLFRPGAEKHLLGEWFERMAAEMPKELEPVLTSLLSALNLGKANLDAFAKALYPERKKGIGEIRDEFVEGITDKKRYAQFGVWRNE